MILSRIERRIDAKGDLDISLVVPDGLPSLRFADRELAIHENLRLVRFLRRLGRCRVMPRLGRGRFRKLDFNCSRAGLVRILNASIRRDPPVNASGNRCNERYKHYKDEESHESNIPQDHKTLNGGAD